MFIKPSKYTVFCTRDLANLEWEFLFQQHFEDTIPLKLLPLVSKTKGTVTMLLHFALIHRCSHLAVLPKLWQKLLRKVLFSFFQAVQLKFCTVLQSVWHCVHPHCLP